MHPNDEHFLVVGTVEDPDMSALRQPACCAPEKIVRQVFFARLLETRHLAALRVNPGHHMANRAVLPGRVHALENDQQRIVVGRIVKMLERAQLCNVFFQEGLILLLRFAIRLNDRRPFLEVELLSPSFGLSLGKTYLVLIGFIFLS